MMLVANHVRLGTTSLISGRCSPYAVDIEPDGLIRVQIPTMGEIRLASGSVERSFGARGDACLLPAAPVTTTVPGRYASTVVTAERARIQGLMEALGSSARAEAALDASFGLAGLPEAPAFVAQAAAICRSLDEAPAALLALDAFKRSNDELLAIRLAHLLSAAAGLPEAAAALEPATLRRCLDYLHAHAFDDVSLEAMGREAGVSLRAAQMLFRRHLDTTITGYLRGLRLTAARERLGAPSTGDTVTSVALDCGFSHLGEFAAAYKAAFGERPSQTLQAGRASRPAAGRAA
ncbi:helix-turn-helix domain-containing protein [Alsobacter sp. R-9]